MTKWIFFSTICLIVFMAIIPHIENIALWLASLILSMLGFATTLGCAQYEEDKLTDRIEALENKLKDKEKHK